MFRKLGPSTSETFEGSNLANGKISEAPIFEELNLPNGKISKAQIVQISRLGKFESRKSKTVEDQHFSIDAANHLNFHLAANKPGCAAPRPPQSPAKRNQKIDIFIYHYQLPQKPRASLRSLQPHPRPISAIYIYTLFHTWLYRRESTSNGPPNNYDRALTGRGGFEFPSAYSVA